MAHQMKILGSSLIETEDEVEDIARFKDRIDTRHGYVTIERAVHDFHEDKVMQEAVEQGETYSVCYNAGPLLPDTAEYSKVTSYDEECRSEYARMLDCQLPQVIQSHENPTV